MTYPEPIVLAETTSTNTYLATLCQKEACAELTTVYSSFQSAGRGQRGNSWESEAGKTCSSVLLFIRIFWRHTVSSTFHK